jgi:hypothetical protein
VRGQVADSVTAAPVGTGFVVLLGPDGEEIDRALTDRNGRFTFRIAPDQAGPLRIRSERIGYHVVLTEPFDAPRRGDVEITIWVGSLPVPLSMIEVQGSTECRVRPGEQEQTAVVWEEARKALAAASWTASEQTYRMVSNVYHRDLDGFRERVLGEEHELFVGFFATAFVSRDPGELEREGYVLVEDTAITFYAPDAEVFQDDGFLETHCFRLSEEAEEGDVLGLAFEPIPSRDLADVEGVLWLDRASSELRSIQYTYTNLEYNLQTIHPVGGTVEFMPLPSGAWIVHRWHISVPTAVIDEREHPLAELRHVVEEWGDAGGEVLTITDTNGVRVYLAELAEVMGVVVDSTAGSMQPLAGATVQIDGTWFKGTTNPQGIFRLATPLEGELDITFSHPRADSLGYTPPLRPVTLARGETDTLWMSVPPLGEVLGGICAGFPLGPDARVLVGTVRDSTGAPAQGAQVIASWQATSPNLQYRDRRARVTTDEDGKYALCGLESGHPALVYAEHDKTASELVRVSFEDAGIAVGGGFFPRSERIWPRDLTVRTPTSTLVTGIVTEVASGNAIPGVSVTVAGTDLTAATDSVGVFRLEGLPPGAHRVMVSRPGYSTRLGDVGVERDRPTIARSQLVALAPEPQVTGTLREEETGEPLFQAWAILVSSDGDSLVMFRSDSSGRFVLTAPVDGSYSVVARRDGYAPRVEGPFELRAGTAVDVELALRPLGYALEPTTVIGAAPVAALTAAGFYARQERGQGVFLDRAAIERRAGASELGDLLRAIPGITVDYNGLIRLRGIVSGPASGCGAPLVYLDGFAVNRDEAASGQVSGNQWQRSVHPSEIAGIEVYRSPSEVPAQYNTGGMAACGVILIWMMQGG